jgi:FxsC-like protein
MAHEFFFSYTRANNDAYLKAFFDDLSEEVRQKRGLPKDCAVGFLDQRALELGEDWDATIVEALQQSKVLVAAASPGYFKSLYCGKEWALFRMRMQAAGADGAKLPPLLKSVVWVEYALDGLPAEVRAAQLTRGDPHALHNTKGLRYVLKQIQDHRGAYNDFVDHLAGEIVAAGDAHAIPPLPDVPRLCDVASAFVAPVSPMQALVSKPLPAAAPSGPHHVTFIYVAADPMSFGNARPAEPYIESGGGDWRPFYPADQRRVHPLMQHLASDPALDFSSIEVPFGPDLIEQIERAWSLRQVVVLVVDPWSVHWDSCRPNPEYRDLLRKLDARLDYHWCVLVPWNENDPVLGAQRDAVAAALHGTFDRHATLAPNPLFFRDGIRTVGELKHAVAEVLTRLKEEIKKRAAVDRPVPTGPARVVVTGPST